MKKLNFSIAINASGEKVWNTLWNDASYRKWTAVFDEGSYAVSDWNEGSKVSFLSSTGSGMYSIIDRKIVNEFMSFKHMGEIKNGEEQAGTPETEQWSGAMENYTISEKDGSTELKVDMDITESHESYFKENFPKALERVKELAEN